MIGQTISHYRIKEKLGEGGMGVVYKAHDNKLDRTVALKFLPPHLTKSDEDKQRFIREAKAAAALNHPHICTIYSVEEYEGQQFISMEYIDGVTLREKSEVGDQRSEVGSQRSGSPATDNRSLTTVIEYAIQIVEALAEAHDKGIVHRDIKPENIMVDSKNRIKVMDFGLAKLKGAGNLTKAGSTVGTMAYMSPEQIQGQDVDHRSDIFSFGVVLYEMLTGRKPFRGEHEAAIMYSIVNENPVPISDYSPDTSTDLIHVVERLLEKDAQDRYQGFDDILGELKRIRKKSTGKIPVKTPPHSGTVNNASQDETKHTTTVTLSIPSFGNKTTIGVSSLLLITVIVFVLWFLFTSGDTITADANSIAVLPFENLSPNPDDAYFTDGVHDDIITQLSQIRDLRVIARSSVMNYPVGSRDHRQIGEELNISTVMEGSIRRAGDVVRVSVQLVDLQTMETLWAEIYERNLTDIFAIQSQIAREISSSLRVSMTQEEKEQLETPLTGNPEAYDMYLKAGEYWRRPGYEQRDWDIVIEFLEKAVELDPEFTAAVAGLSHIHANYYWFGHDQTPQRLEKAKQYAERAYELDPDSEFTNTAMGNYYYRSRDYARALSYANKTTNYALTAYVQRRMGIWDEFIENLKKEIERNPLSSDALFNLALSYWHMRKYEKAEEYFQRTLDIAPDFTGAKVRLAALYIYWKGDVEPLRNYVSQNPNAHPENIFMLRNFERMLPTIERNDEEIFTSQYYITPESYFTGLAYTYLGDTQTAEDHFETAQSVLEELLQEQPEDLRIRARLSTVYAYLDKTDRAIREAEKVMELVPLEYDSMLGAAYIINAAYVYAIAGEYDKAVQLLEKALEIPSTISRNSIKIDPRWDSLREHESFRQLIAKEM